MVRLLPAELDLIDYTPPDTGRDPAPPEPASFLEALGAAYRTENPETVSIGRYMRRQGMIDNPDFRLSASDLSGYEDHAHRFVDVRSRAETALVKREIDAYRQDKAKIEQFHWSGQFLMEGLAGVTTLSTLLPAGGVARTATGAVRLGRTALQVGGLGGVSAGLDEAVLYQQPGRTREEALAGVAFGAILAGAVGGASGIFARRAFNRRMAMYKKIDEGDEAIEQIVAEGMAGREPPQPGAVGARDVELELRVGATTARHIADDIGAAVPEVAATVAARQDVLTGGGSLLHRALDVMYKAADDVLARTGDAGPMTAAIRALREFSTSEVLQRDIARRSGLTDDQVRQWLDGQADPPIAELATQARAAALDDAISAYKTDPGAVDPTLRQALDAADDAVAAAATKTGLEELSGGRMAEGHDAVNRMMQRATDETTAKAARESVEVMDRSVGAAEAPRLDPEGETLTRSGRAAMKIARFLRDPLAALSTSPSTYARYIVPSLAETTGIKTKYNTGHAEVLSVETRLRFWRGRQYLATANMQKEFLAYRGYDTSEWDATIGAELALSVARDVAGKTPEGKLSYHEFKQQVFHAKMRGNLHDIPEVQRAAEYYEKTLYGPLRDAAIKEELLPPGIAPEPGEVDQYINRVYDHAVLASDSEKFVALAQHYMREEIEKKRVIQARTAVDLADSDRAEIERAKADRRIVQINNRMDRMNAAIAEAELGVRRAETRVENAEDRAIAADIEVQDATRIIDEYVDKVAKDLETEGEFQQAASELRRAGASVTREEMDARRAEHRAAVDAINSNPDLKAVFSFLSHRRAMDDAATMEMAETFASAAEAAGVAVDTPRRFARFFADLGVRGDDVLAEIDAQLADMADEIAARRGDLTEAAARSRSNVQRLRKALGEARKQRERGRNKASTARAVLRETGVALAQRQRRLDDLYDRRARAGYIREVLERQAAERRAESEAAAQRLEDTVTDWEGHTSVEAKLAIKERDKKAEAAANPPTAMKWEEDPTRPGRLRRAPDPDNQRAPREQGRWASVDRKVKNTARRILDNKMLKLEGEDLENAIRSRAYELKDRILATPGNRLPYEADADNFDVSGMPKNNPNPRGALAVRLFQIPDDYVADVNVNGRTETVKFSDFLITDMELVSGMHTRSVAADVELSRTLGRPRPGAKTWYDEAIRRINEDYNELSRNASEKERARLQRRREQDLQDIGLIVNRLRGSLAIPVNPNGWPYRIQNILLNLNVIRLLGGMTISALPDMMHVIMYNGFDRAGLGPAISGLVNKEALAMSKQQLQQFATAIDILTNHRAAQLSDMVLDHHRLTKGERALESFTSGFGKFGAMMNYWNQTMKHLAGMAVMSRMIPAIENLAVGKASQKDVTKLAAMGIGESEARLIAEQLAQHKKVHKGVHFPETHAWRHEDPDTNETVQYLARLVGGQIAAEVDRIIVTPGQEIPGFMGLPGMKLITQFKSFQVSATQRIMAAGFQQHDAYMLSGLMAMVGTGALAYIVKMQLAGRGDEISLDPSVLIREGIDRSGVTGWLFDVNNILEKSTRGSIGLSAVMGGPPMSRFLSRSMVSALMGPSFGLGNDLFTTFGALTNPSEMSQGDTRAMFRLMPMQNVFWLRWAFNRMREGVNDAFSIPER